MYNQIGGNIIHNIIINEKYDEFKKINLIKEIINDNPDVNLNEFDKSNMFGTPLNYAIKNNYINLSKFLIDKGVKIMSYDLYSAILNKEYDFFKYLINKGGDINEKLFQGETLLHVAYNNNDIDNVKFLINNGADCYVKNNDGDSFFMIIKRNRDEKLLLLCSGKTNIDKFNTDDPEIEKSNINELINVSNNDKLIVNKSKIEKIIDDLNENEKNELLKELIKTKANKPLNNIKKYFIKK